MPSRVERPISPISPIFIVAPPRCGTSLLYECLVSHPDVGFFNRANGNFPNSPWLAHWVTKVGGALHVYRDAPRESRELWFRFFRGRDQDLADERDAKPEVRDWYSKRIARVLELRGATRYASKLPAHSVQIAFLTALFPDALFVQPIRDWRAVVASTVVKRKKDYPDRWFGVHFPGWKEQEPRPFHLGAAWQYRVVHEYLSEQAALHPGRFLQVNYEDLVSSPADTMRRTFEFCQLRCDESILARLPAMRPAHDRWRETLTPDALAEIEREHGDFLRDYQPALTK